MIEILVADITTLATDAIVNAGPEMVLSEGGVLVMVGLALGVAGVLKNPFPAVTANVTPSAPRRLARRRSASDPQMS